MEYKGRPPSYGSTFSTLIPIYNMDIQNLFSVKDKVRLIIPIACICYAMLTASMNVPRLSLSLADLEESVK
jgi:hypothetical protein